MAGATGSYYSIWQKLKSLTRILDTKQTVEAAKITILASCYLEVFGNLCPTAPLNLNMLFVKETCYCITYWTPKINIALIDILVMCIKADQK